MSQSIDLNKVDLNKIKIEPLETVKVPQQQITYDKKDILYSYPPNNRFVINVQLKSLYGLSTKANNGRHCICAVLDDETCDLLNKMSDFIRPNVTNPGKYQSLVYSKDGLNLFSVYVYQEKTSHCEKTQILNNRGEELPLSSITGRSLNFTTTLDMSTLFMSDINSRITPKCLKIVAL